MATIRKPTLAGRWPDMQRLMRLLSCIRFDEVVVLQGTPLLGALFSTGPLTLAKCVELAVLAIANGCLVAHVFLLNDWSGARTDLRDPNRAEQVYISKGVDSRAVACLCILLLAFALALFGVFGLTSVLLALAVASLSALYSAPGLPLKGVPVAGSLLHLLGGLAHFLLGYSAFHALDGRALCIGAFFALTFTAGHLTHEARDSVGDELNGIRTNAVAFGQKWTFVAGVALFACTDVWLVVLAVLDIVPRLLMLVAAAYPLHLTWAREAWNRGLGFENIRSLQRRYRLLYVGIGIAMALATRFV